MEKQTWTPEREQYIIDNYRKVHTSLIAQELGISKTKTEGKIQHLKQQGRLEYVKPRTQAKKIDSLTTSCLEVGKLYKVLHLQPYHGINEDEEFKGELIQKTKDLIVIKCKLGYCESYLLSDIDRGATIVQEGGK